MKFIEFKFNDHSSILFNIDKIENIYNLDNKSNVTFITCNGKTYEIEEKYDDVITKINLFLGN